MRFGRSTYVIASALLVATSCGTTPRDGFGGAPSSDGGGGAFGSSDAGEAAPPAAIGAFTGRVLAPEGTIPISGALVYLASAAPGPQRVGVHCDTCIELAAGTPYTYSAADGTFTVPVYREGPQHLVVQKGQFRRVRPVTAEAKTLPLGPALTTLPGTSSPAAGDEMPSIAVAHGGFDKIDFSLKKLGIEGFDRFGSAPFEPPGLPPSKGAPLELVSDPAMLAKYAIVLLPCSIGGLSCGAPSGPQKDALRGYVEAGGKLYATDYSYEWVNQTWPGFITWKSKTGSDLSTSSPWGDACQDASYTSPGQADDPGLGAWLAAIGEGSFSLENAWTKVSSVSPRPGLDPAGNPVTITPKVWVSGQGSGPATVSFEQRCGRVLFSTYHAEGDADDALLAQEKALLYILLEVSVCVGKLPPPR